MKSSISKDIDVKITEMKNFVAYFSSKLIDVGGFFQWTSVKQLEKLNILISRFFILMELLLTTR